VGVKGRKLKCYTADFKISAVEEVLISHMGQRETARKYGVTHKMIQTWIRTYLEKGKDYFSSSSKNTTHNDIVQMPIALQSDNEPTHVETRKSRTKKVDESSLSDEVRDELHALRMENDYLKKLNALVRKREKSPTRIKLK
jgi:transposase